MEWTSSLGSEISVPGCVQEVLSEQVMDVEY